MLYCSANFSGVLMFKLCSLTINLMVHNPIIKGNVLLFVAGNFAKLLRNNNRKFALTWLVVLGAGAFFSWFLVFFQSSTIPLFLSQ